jgi:hypothetical protein
LPPGTRTPPVPHKILPDFLQDYKFKASLGYKAKPYLKKEKQERIKNEADLWMHS